MSLLAFLWVFFLASLLYLLSMHGLRGSCDCWGVGGGYNQDGEQNHQTLNDWKPQLWTFIFHLKRSNDHHYSGWSVRDWRNLKNKKKSKQSIHLCGSTAVFCFVFSDSGWFAIRNINPKLWQSVLTMTVAINAEIHYMYLSLLDGLLNLLIFLLPLEPNEISRHIKTFMPIADQKRTYVTEFAKTSRSVRKLLAIYG